MTRLWMGIALGLGLSACGGTAPFGQNPDANEPDVDTATAGSVYLTEQPRLTLNNITYDPGTDTLTLNNIPFDDPQNAYERVATDPFSNGFNAYESAPAVGTNELLYFAVFKRSASGQSQVAAAGTDTYIDFGYGGAGAQRLGANPNLPTTGIYSYNGEYAAVRTASNAIGGGVQYVTGDATMRADFDDFDIVGAFGGTITNRNIYDTTGTLIGPLSGFLSLTDATIVRNTGSFTGGSVVEIDGGTNVRSGDWQGVFAANGREVAGILFVEGADIREVGGFIAECSGAPCP